MGSAPNGNVWTIFNGKGCSGSSPYPITVVAGDATNPAHSGTHQVMVTGGDSCGPVMANAKALAMITGGEFYGRFFMRLPSTMTHHNPLMTLGLKANADMTTSFDQTNHLQLAAEDVSNANVLVWQVDDGHILPSKDTMGAAATTYPKANTWTCVEFHLSAGSGALETWVDGNAISGLTVVSGTPKMSGVNDQWPPVAPTPWPVAPTSLGFTGIALGGTPMSFWIDDVALGPSRIGCK